MTSPLRVVLDTDFLSSCLKVRQLQIVRNFYRVADLWVPLAVYREVSLTDLLNEVIATPWVKVEAPEPRRLHDLMKDEGLRSLGPGEREAIALALQEEDSMLLMNDNRAMKVATRLGVRVVNLPGFLLACKLSGFLDQAEIIGLIESLEREDHYGFRRDVRDLLIS